MADDRSSHDPHGSNPGIAFDARALQVLYEDNHLIAVFKPASVLTQGDASGDPSLLEVVKAWLKARHDKPGRVFLGLLHRLDRPVSGVVLFAKTSKGASRLSAQIRARTLDKTYRALVDGAVSGEAGELRHFLSEGKRADGRTATVEAFATPGPARKEARLRYRVLRLAAGRSLLEIDLETGRKHQIRAQLSAIGHPIVGDARYGGPPGASTEAIALCAVRLAFDHPIDKGRVVVALPEAVIPLALRDGA